MYQGKTYVLFIRYAVPQVIGLLFNSVYFIVDGIFIGNRLGREALAAAAISVPLIEVLISLAMAVASGAGVLISNYFGQRENAKAVHAFNTAAWMLAIAGICITVLGNLCIVPLAKVLGATPDILSQAIVYMRYILTFAPFQLFSFLLGGMARNDERPKLAMLALTVGAVSNIILDFVFMYPLHMGIRGAALATALGPIFSVLILLGHFLFKRGNLYFSRQKIYGKEVIKILTLGFPSFVMEFSIGMMVFVYNAAITRNGYGEIGLAAYLLIGYLLLIILTVYLGMAEGLQPVFSYLSSIGETKRNKDLRVFATRILVGIGLLFYVWVLFFAQDFYAIFSPTDLELISFAREKSLRYFSLFFLAGYNILMISFWQSIRDTKQALMISLLRSIIVPPILIYILPMIFGRESIWLCQSFSEAATALTAVSFLIQKRQKV